MSRYTLTPGASADYTLEQGEGYRVTPVLQDVYTLEPAEVTPGGTAPSFSTSPTISGDPLVDETLTVSYVAAGDPTPTAGVQWQRQLEADDPIVDPWSDVADGELEAGDVGYRFRVGVTLTNGVSPDVTEYSAATDVVTALFEQSPDYAGLTRYEWSSHQAAIQYADLALVPAWTDVAQGLDIGQVLTSKQAQMRHDIGGYPGLRWDGADDDMFGDSTGIDTASGVTVFVVGYLESYAKFAGFLAFKGASGDAGTSNRMTMYASASTNFFVTANRPTGLNYYDDSTFDIIGSDVIATAEMIDGLDGTRGLYKNGVLVDGTEDNAARAIQPANTHASLHFGMGYGNTGAPTVIRHVLMYTGGAMTPAQIAAVVASLDAQYGVTS